MKYNWKKYIVFLLAYIGLSLIDICFGTIFGVAKNDNTANLILALAFTSCTEFTKEGK